MVVGLTTINYRKMFEVLGLKGLQTNLKGDFFIVFSDGGETEYSESGKEILKLKWLDGGMEHGRAKKI